MNPDLTPVVECLGIPQAQRHIFLCTDPSKPKCCPVVESLTAWEYLKGRLKELGLDRPQAGKPGCILRTKADCLRICAQGPILLIYPDGVWYRQATPPVIEEIIQRHLLKGEIVEEYVIYTHPLPNPIPEAEISS